MAALDEPEVKILKGLISTGQYICNMINELILYSLDYEKGV
jgi:hypothetical protein